MASTLTKLLVHVTFSTKGREPLIPASVEQDLYSYIGGICRGDGVQGSVLLCMGGVADHVHMLVSLSKTVSLADLLLNVKRDSSKWIKERDRALAAFSWQQGYFAFTIGQSGVPDLRAYIARQKEHHHHLSFRMRCGRSCGSMKLSGMSDMCGSEVPGPE